MEKIRVFLLPVLLSVALGFGGGCASLPDVTGVIDKVPATAQGHQ